MLLGWPTLFFPDTKTTNTSALVPKYPSPGYGWLGPRSTQPLATFTTVWVILYCIIYGTISTWDYVRLCTNHSLRGPAPRAKATTNVVGFNHSRNGRQAGVHLTGYSTRLWYHSPTRTELLAEPVRGGGKVLSEAKRA